MRQKSLNRLKAQSLGSLERVVTVLVEAQLSAGTAVPPDLIDRLRRLERRVREERGGRQALQVIESGRRLLGDTGEHSQFEKALSMDVGDFLDGPLASRTRRH